MGESRHIIIFERGDQRRENFENTELPRDCEHDWGVRNPDTTNTVTALLESIPVRGDTSLRTTQMGLFFRQVRNFAITVRKRSPVDATRPVYFFPFFDAILITIAEHLCERSGNDIEER